MGIYLNPGSENFEMILNTSIYVDKSMILQLLNQAVNTSNRFICVGRARRFGKTFTAEMIGAYYDRTVDGRAIFSNLKFYHTDSFNRYANKFNVLHINMLDFMSRTSNIDDMLNRLQQVILKDLHRCYKNVDYLDIDDLFDSMEDIFQETKTKFVIIIDEWDCVFRRYQNNEAYQIQYLDFLRSWMKDRKYIALAYMTGILPIKKYGEHSALNMFIEYSMEAPMEMAEFTGFTDDDVRKLCEKYNVNYEQCKSWYDGYLMSGAANAADMDNKRIYEIYNPLSIVRAISNREFKNYWNKTETYEALKKYIIMNYDGLKDTVIELMAGGRKKISTVAFQNDMSSFSSADDVLTLLIHLGYLSYDSIKEEVFIPNNEVRDEFLTSIKNEEDWSIVTKAIINSEATLQATWNKNESVVAAALENAHFETSILQYNDENALSYVISLAYYTARSRYNIVREMPAGKGFADLVFIPLEYCRNIPAIIVELKWNKQTDTAIRQIVENKYCKALGNYKGEVLLVAVNYDKKATDDNAKKHSCEIHTIYI